MADPHLLCFTIQTTTDRGTLDVMPLLYNTFLGITIRKTSVYYSIRYAFNVNILQLLLDPDKVISLMI